MGAETKSKNQIDTMQIAIRAIVMFFGLSMVILGSHAIKVQHGSVSNYLKKGSQPIVSRVEQKLPKVEWNKVSKLFKLERAKQTWEMKTEKITPAKDQKPS